MKEDIIEIEVLEDGTIKVTTDQISPANHMSADQFLKQIEQLAGGEITKQKNRKAHGHVHQHGELKQPH